MENKLIRNVDEDTWRRFAGYCKIKNKKIGKMLSEVLKEYLKGKIK